LDDPSPLRRRMDPGQPERVRDCLPWVGVWGGEKRGGFIVLPEEGEYSIVGSPFSQGRDRGWKRSGGEVGRRNPKEGSDGCLRVPESSRSFKLTDKHKEQTKRGDRGGTECLSVMIFLGVDEGSQKIFLRLA